MWQYCWTLLDIVVRSFRSRCPFDSFLLYHSIGLFILPWRFNSLYNDVTEKVKCLWVARNSSTCYMIVPWWHVRYGRFLVSHMERETWFPAGPPENKQMSPEIWWFQVSKCNFILEWSLFRWHVHFREFKTSPFRCCWGNGFVGSPSFRSFTAIGWVRKESTDVFFKFCWWWLWSEYYPPGNQHIPIGERKICFKSALGKGYVTDLDYISYTFICFTESYCHRLSHSGGKVSQRKPANSKIKVI